MKIRSRIDRRTAVRLVYSSIVLVLSASYFARLFRLPHDTMLKSGLGDWVDPYFINFLLEHWHHSVWSFTDPSSPPMYFPVRGTLGYSHGLILYAPFYLAVRPWLDPFQAYNVTLFLVLETGSLCLYLVLRRFVGLRFVESLLLSAFFFSSRNVVNGAMGVWSQRASVFLIPPILLIALVSTRKPKGRLRLGLSWLSGLLFSLLFTQDFYTGAFALLVVVLLLAGALLLAQDPIGQAAVELWQTSALIDRSDPGRLPRRPSSWWLIAAALSLAWALAVLIHPIERTAIGSWRFSATDPTRPFFIALLTAGWFACRHICRLERILRGGSRIVAFKSPVNERIAALWARNRSYILAFATGGVIGCFVFLWIYVPAYREHHAFPDDQLMSSLTALDPSSWQARLDFVKVLGAYDSLRSFGLVWLVGILAWVPWLQVNRTSRLSCLWVIFVSSIVLAVPLRFNDFSIWKIFFAPLPGFSVIRDPRRIISLYELAVVLLTGFLLSQLPSKSRFRISIVALVFLLLVTDWSREVFDFGRPTSVYTRWVKAPIDIDASCKCFFIKGASQAYMSRSFHMWALYGVDSMFISLAYSIPTLNGYSAWSPNEWGLANPQEPGYARAVERWIDRHSLRGVCELDIENRTMRPYSREPPGQ